MGRISLVIACALCKASRALLHVLGRGGTSLPGRIARRVCPSILEYLAKEMDVVLVSGTNGKTTTCTLLRQIAEQRGINCVANASGANLLGGIVAAFACKANWRGCMKSDLAIIECDEATLPQIANDLSARAIVVTNLFRDQLDRYGELSTTRDKLLCGIRESPKAALVLNADCSLTATLAQDNPNQTFYFGLETGSEAHEGAVADAPRCHSCGCAYAYRSHVFAHLGDWYCPHCGMRRPDPDVRVRATDFHENGMELICEAFGEELVVSTALTGDYNAYNIAASIATADALGWNVTHAAQALARAGASFGRGEIMSVEGHPARLYLAKNPAGLDRVLELLEEVQNPHCLVFCLNDKDADGTDISWIWDADIETFFARRQPCVLGVWGRRREDMRLRLFYAARERGAFEVEDLATAHDLRRYVAQSELPVYIVANYTAMLAARRALLGRRKAMLEG